MLFLMRTTLVCEMHLSLPHDYLMGAKALVMLLSSPKPSWPGGTEGFSWVPYCNLAPLSPFAVNMSHSVYIEVMLLRHEGILCHVITKTLQP